MNKYLVCAKTDDFLDHASRPYYDKLNWLVRDYVEDHLPNRTNSDIILEHLQIQAGSPL